MGNEYFWPERLQKLFRFYENAKRARDASEVVYREALLLFEKEYEEYEKARRKREGMPYQTV